MNEELIDNLEFNGPHTDIKMINEILKYPDESFRHLAEIATTSQY